MKFFGRLFGDRLQTSWELAPGGIVWKILITESGLLVGESRDLDAHTMSLFAIDLEAGSFVFSGRELPERWWIALEMVIGDIAILHGYPRPDMPNTLGLTAVDARSGQTLWSNPELRMICGTAEIGLAQRGSAIDEGELLFVDARTGATLESANIERAREFERTCEMTNRWEGWTPADDLTETDPRYPAVRTLVEREAGPPQGAIEIAEHNGTTVLSAHTPSRVSADAALNNRVDNHLFVVRDERIVWRDVIAQDLPRPGSDTFFIRRGVLYAIRQGRTLVAVALGEE